METTTIKITARNNSDARNFDVLDEFRGASARHNGGKVVIATVRTADLVQVIETLGASHAVAGYEVRS
jgi:ribosome-interacting GTPase 1